jgi:hypothetical protein
LPLPTKDGCLDCAVGSWRAAPSAIPASLLEPVSLPASFQLRKRALAQRNLHACQRSTIRTPRGRCDRAACRPHHAS